MKSSDHRKTITKRENSQFKFFKISVNFCINFGISSFLGTLRVNPDRTRFARVKIVVATATRGRLNFPASARLNRSWPSPASEWPLLPIRFKSGRATDQLSHQLTWRHSTIYCEIDKCCEFTRKIMMESIINQRLNFDEMSCDEEEDNSSEATNSSNSGKSFKI